MFMAEDDEERLLLAGTGYCIVYVYNTDSEGENSVLDTSSISATS